VIKLVNQLTTPIRKGSMLLSLSFNFSYTVPYLPVLKTLYFIYLFLGRVSDNTVSHIS